MTAPLAPLTSARNRREARPTSHLTHPYPALTRSRGGPSADYGDGDTPEFVAEIVVKAIEEGEAQYFANDRLRQLAGA